MFARCAWRRAWPTNVVSQAFLAIWAYHGGRSRGTFLALCFAPNLAAVYNSQTAAWFSGREIMRLRRLPGLVGSFVRYCVWWATIGPFCVASDLSLLGSTERRPIRLGSEPDQYPITELL